MKSYIPLLLAATATLAVAFVDEANDAVVIEEEDGALAARMARQLEVADTTLYDLGISPLLTPPLYQPCLNKQGKMGRCLSLKECYPYFKIFELGWRDTWVMGHYDTCSYRSPQGAQVFGVCCNQQEPTAEELVQLEKEEQERQEVIDQEKLAVIEDFPIEFQLASNCGLRTPKPVVTLYNQLPFTPYIVNGDRAIPHEYPFMAAIMNRNRQFCGGSLIDDNHILTAAHCVAHLSRNDVQHLRVRLGDHNIKTSSEAFHVEKRVKRVIRHVGFSSSTLHNDVAILTLEDDVEYSDTIQPICLAQGTNDFYDQIVSVAGWGTLTEGGSQPASLMKVNVKVWNNADCRNSYGNNAPGGITSSMLCASLPSKDSCSGDSGGPLFSCPQGAPCTQVGIVSWGIGCAKAKYPGVYTRVTSMRTWIRNIVENY